VNRTSVQLEAAALRVPCSTHQAPAGSECPDGGACMDRYGLSPDAWAGWFTRDGDSPASPPAPGDDLATQSA
jgi:hypothetical protein